MIPRDRAWSILTEFTRSDSLRKHARAVEASMRAYAGQYGEDAEVWGVAGMLHDFDYEVHPRAPHHPLKGAEVLISRGVPDAVVRANALSLSFFRTDATSRPVMTLPGLTSATAWTKPESSSHAYKARSRSDTRGTPP